jgi:hypothetical protein
MLADSFKVASFVLIIVLFVNILLDRATSPSKPSSSVAPTEASQEQRDELFDFIQKMNQQPPTQKAPPSLLQPYEPPLF